MESQKNRGSIRRDYIRAALLKSPNNDSNVVTANGFQKNNKGATRSNISLPKTGNRRARAEFVRLTPPSVAARQNMIPTAAMGIEAASSEGNANATETAAMAKR